MANKRKGFISEWQRVSELRPVGQDMSDFGYRKEYIEANGLNDTKVFHWSNSITGVMNFFEPLEVMLEDGKVYYRVNENHVHMDEPEYFDTQFGRFNNHNRGEFHSWLGRDGYEGLPVRERELNALFGINDYFIEGNFCDMFDCGKYSYAISNLMHMGLGEFKIVRIDRNLEAETLYENYRHGERTRLEYIGRFKSLQGYVVIASGMLDVEKEIDQRGYQNITILFLIDENGNCTADKRWNITISSPNSMVAVDGYVYFGQNKMVTRLNVETGEVAFFTNKSDEELDALVEWKW